MTAKLLKYDFKSTGRILLPLFGALLAIALLLGISLGAQGNANHINYTFNWITQISMILYIVLIAAVGIITLVMLLYQGFYKSTLGSEGYFRLTLPVSIGQHLASKTINAGIWFILASVVGFLSVMFAMLPSFGMADFLDGMRRLAAEFAANDIARREILHYGAQILLLVLGGGVAFILKAFASITVGNEWSAHPLLGGLLAFIVFSILEGILETLIPGDLQFANATYFDNAQMHSFLWFVLAIVVVEAVIYYAITWFMLDRRLNLQ